MMSSLTSKLWLCLLCILATSAINFSTASEQEPKESKENKNDNPASIIGTWESQARHAVHASLYQPEHRARLRTSMIHFKADGNGLIGYSLLPNHTMFQAVKFDKGQLSFEFDIAELDHGWGNQKKCKACVRVEAKFNRDRLIGNWRLLEKISDHELFRGEWEAIRAKEQTLGAVVLAGGGELPEAARIEFLRLAGDKDQARIVVIPTASAQDNYTGKEEFLLDLWKGAASVRILHTRDRKTANDPAFLAPLANATGVWFTNGHTDRLLNAYQGTKVEAELKRLLERGGVVGGKDAGAVVLAERVHQRFDPDVLSPGYGLLPGVMSARGFGGPDRMDLPVLDRNPQYSGLGIPNETAVIVRGQNFRIYGKGPVLIYWPKSATNPARQDLVPANANYNLKERKVYK